MSNIIKNYLRVLEVISSLNCELEFKSDVGRKQKMSDLEVVALSLTAEFMSIDSENSLKSDAHKYSRFVQNVCQLVISRTKFFFKSDYFRIIGSFVHLLHYVSDLIKLYLMDS